MNSRIVVPFVRHNRQGEHIFVSRISRVHSRFTYVTVKYLHLTDEICFCFCFF